MAAPDPRPLSRRQARAIALDAAIIILEQAAYASSIWEDQYAPDDVDRLRAELLLIVRGLYRRSRAKR